MFVSGLKTLASTSPEQLVAPGSAPANRITNITLQCDPDSETLYVGGSNVTTATGIQLEAGQAESFSASDAADIYVVGPVGAAVRYRAKAL